MGAESTTTLPMRWPLDSRPSCLIPEGRITPTAEGAASLLMQPSAGQLAQKLLTAKRGAT